MDCQAIERYQPTPQSRFMVWRSRLVNALTLSKPGHPKLDLEIMSDYMKRDMGFMDGRGPRQDSDMTR